MEEKDRLQQLAGIKEIRVNKPGTKKELLLSIFEEGYSLLTTMCDYNKQDFLQNQGFDNISELVNELGYDEYLDPLIEKYFQLFKPHEIECFLIGDDEDINEMVFKNSYSKAIMQGDGDGNAYICLHNL